MKTFLEYVAEDIINKYGTNLSRVAVVFPNKRAALFLNDSLARIAGKPIWSPAYITISELFRKHSGLSIGDPIKLICDLHKSFTEQTGIDETLDHFYGWGQLLLSDFDDIDKNMADAKQIFANLKDIHKLDDISYLTESQKEMLKKFFSNFTEEHNSELKRRFLQLWSRFGNIYEKYRERLRSQQIAYEGMLYREVAENKNIEFQYNTYLFIGFNLLHKVELSVFNNLARQGKAHFYWDFDHYYIDGNNEAGHHIKQHLKHFPNELDCNDKKIYANLNEAKNITYISAPTENIQARYISTWLRENGRITAGKRTAIVLCNEGLLQTVIHCLPEETGKVNITTGYPLAQSPVCSLVNQMITMQTDGYIKSSECFRLHNIKNVLNHPYSRFISKDNKILRNRLISNKIFFPTISDLAVNEDFKQLFVPAENNHKLLLWILGILKKIAGNARNTGPLLQESLFRTYTLLNRLKEIVASGDLDVDIITLQRLIRQLFSTTSVPFHGEPAVGIQIMGMLETRNLDFENILVLSCNEGNMPKGINDSSFIPYSIRKAYGLTTVDNKIDIYAYYFNRMLQRAENITILYNNSTENGHTGEMSRFMLQLMVESKHTISRMSLQSGQRQTILRPHKIEKGKRIMEILYGIKYISPTAVNRYIRCPLQFYYNNIEGIIKPDDNDNNEIDNRIFGNIFHCATELIYNQIKGTVTADVIDRFLKHREQIEIIVDRAFRKELFMIQDERPFRMQLNGMQLINREVTIRYLQRLLEIDKKLTPFVIIGTEKKVEDYLTVETQQGKHIIKVGGMIDRLDSITDPTTGKRHIRVIDYKTGNRMPTKKVNDIGEIFDPLAARDKHTDYYLQTMLYSMIVRNNRQYNNELLPVSPVLLFIQHTAGDNYDPTLSIGKEKITDIQKFTDEFHDNLIRLITEIYNPQYPFVPTEDKKTCSSCPYKLLCGI